MINIYYVDQKKNLNNDLIKILSEKKYYKNTFFENCLSDPPKYIEPKNSCLIGGVEISEYAFLGDSHMGIIAKELDKQLKKTKKSGHLLVYNGCLPSLNLKILNDRRFKCHEYYSDVYSFLKSQDEVKKIVLFYRWPFYFSGKRFNNLEGGIEIGSNHLVNPIDENKQITELQKYDLIKNNITEYLDLLTFLNKEIVIIFSTPEMGWEIPTFLAKKYLKENNIDKYYLSISKKLFMERNENVFKFFKSIEKKYNLKVIYPHELFCDDQRCLAHMDGYPIFYDDDHLSSLGSEMLSKKIIQSLK